MITVSKIDNIKFLYSNIIGSHVHINELDLSNKIFLKKNIIIATLPIFRINYYNKTKTCSVESYKDFYDEFYNSNKICYIYKLDNSNIIRGVITNIEYNENMIFYYKKNGNLFSNAYYELFITNNEKSLLKNKINILKDLLISINSPNKYNEKLIKILANK